MKEQRRGHGTGRLVAAFGLGATLGSIIALLYAPASGEVTRRRIANKVRVIRRKAVLLREQAAERFTDARNWVTEHMPNGHNGRRTRHQTAHS